MPYCMGARNRGPAYWAERWTEEQDLWLQAACKTPISYSQMAQQFNEAFPTDRKSRNAVLGRAARKGYSKDKPGAGNNSPTRALRKPAKVVNIKKAARAALVKKVLAPVVFKNAPALRDDADPFIRRSHPHMVRKPTTKEVEHARKGQMLCVVEENPLTSVPMSQTSGHVCTWPTSDDASQVCGVPATIGSYCDRHGRVAYREAPTRKRNRIRMHAKEDRDWAMGQREQLDPDGEWINRQILKTLEAVE